MPCKSIHYYVNIFKSLNYSKRLTIGKMNSEKSFKMGIPKLVTLSWNSINVEASAQTLLTKAKSIVNKRSTEYKLGTKTILKNVDGLVRPGSSD